MSNAETLRKLRTAAVAAGLCQECRCRPARPGLKSCQHCCDVRKERAAARMAVGLCPCGAEPDGDHAACRACREADRKRWARKRPQLLEAGRCLTCTAPAKPGRTLCEKHLEIQASKAKRRRARRRAEGLCTVDGCKWRPTGDHVLCIKHRLEMRERYRQDRSVA